MTSSLFTIGALYLMKEYMISDVRICFGKTYFANQYAAVKADKKRQTLIRFSANTQMHCGP